MAVIAVRFVARFAAPAQRGPKFQSLDFVRRTGNLEVTAKIQRTVGTDGDGIFRGRGLRRLPILELIAQRTGGTSHHDIDDLVVVGKIGLAPRFATADEQVSFCPPALADMDAKRAMP